MLISSTIIMVIDQLWYKMILNRESNNFLIEKHFPKIIYLILCNLEKIGPKSSIFDEN